MGLQAHFAEGRCYFGQFDKESDINSKTLRGGLNFFRFNVIGYLLHQLGFAHKVSYDEGDKHGVVYLHPKSFKNWKNRHLEDSGLSLTNLALALSQKKFEEVIKIICENFRKNNENFDFEEVLSEKKFEANQYTKKEEEITPIDRILRRQVKTVALVANGIIPKEEYEETAKLIQQFDAVIAVDGGLNHYDAMFGKLPLKERKPLVIIGDLDSAKEELVAKYTELGIPVYKFDAEKDETDLEIAIRIANTASVKNITIFGGHGGRTDHFLPHLHLLQKHPQKVFLENKYEIVYALTGNHKIKGIKGRTISLIPIDGKVQHVNSKGLKWELKNATMDRRFFSVSNVAQEDNVDISVPQGTLICCINKHLA